MRNPTDVLNSLSDKSKNPEYRFQRLYRNLYNPDFYLLAYKNIYANGGSMTPGVNGITIDGMSSQRIQTAIAERKKIAFRYFDYSPSKERVHRHDGQVYSVSPYALLWNNDIYYLVGFHDHRQQVVKFRVDRIDGLKVTQKAAVQKPKDFDVSAYFTQEFSMLTGKTCHITLLCENPLMNSIIDRFGEDAPTQIVDENHFTVEATVDLSSNFYGWVFSSGGKMKITAPQEAVDGFQRMLEINSNPPVKTSHLKGGQA